MAISRFLSQCFSNVSFASVRSIPRHPCQGIQATIAITTMRSAMLLLFPPVGGVFLSAGLSPLPPSYQRNFVSAQRWGNNKRNRQSGDESLQLEIPSNKRRVPRRVDILSRDAAITNRCQKRGGWGKVIGRIDANEFALGATFSISITRDASARILFETRHSPSFSLRSCETRPFF